MKPFTKRLVCSTRRPDNTRVSRCSILLPICLICLTKTKRTRICFKHNNNNNNNNNKSRPRKERKRERERPVNEEILEEKRKTLFPHASVADCCAAFYLSEVLGDAEFTSPAVADTLFRTRRRRRRRRKRSNERVADDTLPISRCFSTAQSEP